MGSGSLSLFLTDKMAIRAVFGARAGSVVSTWSVMDVIKRPFGHPASTILGRPASLRAGSRAGIVSSEFRFLRPVTDLASVGGSRKADHWKECRSTRTNLSGRSIVRVDAMSSSATSASKPLHIIGISGSLRKASANTGLLRAAAEIVTKDFPDVNLEIVDLSDLPFLNTDLEVNGTFPQSVTDFRAKVLAADGVLFASPEYNYSVSPVLKNAIDWASRPPNVWADKGAAVVCAGGREGGARSSYHLRQSGVFLDLHFINKPELFVRIFEPPPKFDQDGNLTDEPARAILTEVVKSLRAWIIRIN